MVVGLVVDVAVCSAIGEMVGSATGLLVGFGLVLQ